MASKSSFLKTLPVGPAIKYLAAVTSTMIPVEKELRGWRDLDNGLNGRRFRQLTEWGECWGMEGR